MHPKYTPEQITRFWSKVDRSGDCWLWTGGKTVVGYGLYYIGDYRRAYAHRFAYEVSKGDIAADMLVCHTCDNPTCVRPDHLWLGTDSDNAWDKVAKGRSCRGDEHGLRKRPDRVARGEGKPLTAKLTETQVRAIRQRYAAGGVTQREIAADYGVSGSLITMIVQRKRWAHI